MCQGGLRKPIQGGGRGVNVHSVRDFPGQGKAAYLVFEVADDDPLTLLSRSSTEPDPAHILHCSTVYYIQVQRVYEPSMSFPKAAIGHA